MSFQNLNSHSQVNAASRSPLIPPVETSSLRAEQTEGKEVLPQERKSSQDTTKFSIRDAAEGYFFFGSRNAGTRAPLSVGKGGFKCCCCFYSAFSHDRK